LGFENAIGTLAASFMNQPLPVYKKEKKKRKKKNTAFL
jgi:hypothetical protein